METGEDMDGDTILGLSFPCLQKTHKRPTQRDRRFRRILPQQASPGAKRPTVLSSNPHPTPDLGLALSLILLGKVTVTMAISRVVLRIEMASVQCGVVHSQNYIFILSSQTRACLTLLNLSPSRQRN